MTATPTVHDILVTVATDAGLTVLDLTSHRRSRTVARPRQIAYWLCYRLTGHSLPMIGRLIGDRDHTTVLYGIRLINRLMAGDPKLADAVMRLAAAIDPVQTLELRGAMA